MKNYQTVDEYLADGNPYHITTIQKLRESENAHTICDNCELDIAIDNSYHRCRADEDSCIDGTNCEDYVATCACEICSEILA